MRLFALTSPWIGLIGLIGCATSPPPEPKGGPRGLRASEHLDVARQHDAIARERETWPDTRGTGPGDMRQPVAMPWYRSWDTGAEHGRLAETHRAKAAEIHALYDEACGDLPASDTNVSPLASYGVDYGGTAIGTTPLLPGMETPRVFWVPGIYPSGLAFYTGDAFPAWRGNVFIGSMGRAASGHLLRVVFDAKGLEIGQEPLLGELHQRIRDVRQGPDGLLYVLTDEEPGALLKIEPVPEVSP